MTAAPIPRRRPTWSARRRAGLALASSLFVLTLAGLPGSGARPVLALTRPSLPVALPSLPVPLPSLPDLPLPTLPLPTLPPLPTVPVPSVPLPSVPLPSVPLPSLPVPSISVPTPSLPLPSLPLPTLPGSTSGPGSPAGAGASIDPLGSPALPVEASGSPGTGAPGVVFGAPAPSPEASGLGQGPLQPVGAGRSPLDFVIPGLIAGVPIAIVAIAILLQVAGGAAWLPMIRRWLHRRLVPGSSGRLP